ncbi:MAG: Ig-like domain-containing protein, partial [Lachnospiraceae bacterium]|nr:Ig-like domain-containing protein [Lachnospiraceae bacterium]
LIKANQKKKLLPTKFVAVRRYFVEDSNIVKVDQNGNLTALKKGKTTLYIKAANGTTAKVTITVK